MFPQRGHLISQASSPLLLNLANNLLQVKHLASVFIIVAKKFLACSSVEID
tara:strand:- start:7985 stop:8137 length:153 start_codon:yes stop_codon:yes gene_type:complete